MVFFLNASEHPSIQDTLLQTELQIGIPVRDVHDRPVQAKLVPIREDLTIIEFEYPLKVQGREATRSLLRGVKVSRDQEFEPLQVLIGVSPRFLDPGHLLAEHGDSIAYAVLDHARLYEDPHFASLRVREKVA